MSDADPAEARERVIAAMEQSAAEYGLPRSCGRLYGICYFAEDPLSLDELADRSGYAKSTVSDVMGALEDLYLARRVSPPDGGRKAYFEAERDLWFATQRIAEETAAREVRLMTRALEDAEKTLEATDAGTDLERVRELQRNYRKAEVALEVLTRVPVERLLVELARVAEGVDAEELLADLE